MSGGVLVLATKNPHKVIEMRRILAEAGLDVEVRDLGAYPEVADVVESGVSFAENAELKARAVTAATGLPAVADDSGLCVEVMGGAPGIFSARWAGRHGQDRANLELLLDQLGDVPDAHRRANFTCAVVLAMPDGQIRTVEGRMLGAIIREPRGENGFGYDPIFVPDGEQRTSAELSDAEKDAISHRGRALLSLVPHLRELLSTTAL